VAFSLVWTRLAQRRPVARDRTPARPTAKSVDARAWKRRTQRYVALRPAAFAQPSRARETRSTAEPHAADAPRSSQHLRLSPSSRSADTRGMATARRIADDAVLLITIDDEQLVGACQRGLKPG